MLDENPESVDPRIRRTRQMLQESLANLLQKREFDEISVQEIAEGATVNRATFYDHYTDKFALLECLVARQFHELLASRGVQYEGGCTAALRAIVLGVCDTLAAAPGTRCAERRQCQMEPHMEAAIVGVVRGMLLDGVRRYAGAGGGAVPELVAGAASWAIYGAAKEWARQPERGSSEAIAGTITELVAPVLTYPTRPR